MKFAGGVLAGLLGAVFVLASGCDSGGEKSWLRPDESAQFGTPEAASKPLPKYSDIAAAYNARLVGTDRIAARANIQLTYIDKEGERKVENPEGTLQVIATPPLRLALSLGKAGQTLFWFGCDGDRYWWLDLSDKNDRVAGVGRLSKFEGPDGAAQARLGIAIRPTDLIRLLGVVPLNPESRAQMQWSRDGKLLGVVTRLDGKSGFQRLWLEPQTYVPRTIELYDKRARLVLVGEHEGQENVQITRTGVEGLVGARPRVPSRVYCRHIESRTDIRLTLTGVRDGPISDKAFDLDELRRRLSVDRTVDLDE